MSNNAPQSSQCITESLNPLNSPVNLSMSQGVKISGFNPVLQNLGRNGNRLFLPSVLGFSISHFSSR